jgi:CheY-like chemotaxis protein
MRRPATRRWGDSLSTFSQSIALTHAGEDPCYGAVGGPLLNVIYIDDDAANRVVLGDMVTAAGLTITAAADAASGLAAIRAGEFDLVLMDLRMPGVSGLTAIRQLRSDTAFSRRHHIVVVTADLTPGIRSLCEDAGADDFLEKPVSMARLIDVIASLMVRTPGLQIN